MKTLKYIVLTLTALAVTLSAAIAVQAAIDTSLTFPTCALSIHPYKVGGVYKDEYDNQWYNRFSGPGVCTSHLSYPNQYTPQPPVASENPLKSITGVENVYAPDTVHNHIYHNASKEDQDSTPWNNFWYKSWMAKFQIILEPDALAKTDKYNVVCGTPTGPGTYVETSCNATLPYWGTTKISYNSSTGVVTWDFAEQSSKKGRPLLWGNNPSLGKSHGYLGTYVKLVSKNNPEDVWSATSTSRVLIRDQALLKWSEDDDASDGDTVNDGDAPPCANDGIPAATKDYSGNWCTTDPPVMSGVEGTEMNDGKQYYWFRIGVVGTTWKKPAEDLAVCDSLDLSINQDGQIFNPVNGATVTGLEPMKDMTMTVQPTFDPITESVPLDYKWSATKPVPPYMIPLAQGDFKDSPAVPVPPSPNPFTDDDTLVYYSGGPGGTTVTVIAVDGGVDQDQCKYEFKIPDVPTVKSCDTLNVLRNGGSYSGTHSVDNPIDNLSVDVSTTPAPYAQDLHYNWTVTNGTGSMNPTPTLSELQTTTLSGVTDGTEVTVSAFDPNDPAANVGACTDTFSFTDIPIAGMCVDLDATLSKEPMNPGDSILVNPSVQYSGIVLPDRIRWEESGAGYFSTNVFLQSMQPWCPVPAPGSFEAPYTCRYYYTAVNVGDSFTLTAIPNPTNNDDCILTREVVDVPDEEECDYLNLYVTGGKVCIDVDPDYEGRYRWTIDGNTFIQDNPICQDYDASSSYLVEGIDAEDVSICSDEMEPEEYQCEWINPYWNGNELCLNVGGGYDGPFVWIVNGVVTEEDVPDYCKYIPPNADYEVYAKDEPNNEDCQLEDTYIPPPPELIKRVSKAVGGSFSTDVLTIPMNHEEIAYELTFDPHGQVTTATIEDDIGPREFGPNLLEAVILPVDAAGNTSPGEVIYNDDMVVREGNTIIQVCTDIYDPAVTPPEDWEHCYLGDIGDGNVKLFKVDGVVTITYSARVETGLTEEICREGIVCQEKYINAADARITELNDQTVNINVNSNQITVQIFCQYILTRAAGDIFLENDLSSGIDINICSQYRSSTGIIITPGEEEVPEILKSGAGSEIFTVGHEVCTSGQAGTIENDLAELYGQEITGLSSQICEVKLRTGSPWKQKVITNTIDENKTRVSRWGADPTLPSNLSGIINTIGLGNSIYADQDVFHIAGDVQTGNIKMDEVGAKTFIVEDGDLYINGNIEYTGTCYEPGGCTVRDVASLAFIVLNGNIYVDKDVNEISGVFFVQEGDDGTGRIMSNEYPGTTETQSDVQLIVYGSIYGDIDPLFSQRFFTGDPSSDLGGIVIRFDQRVILNTPPGLRDVLNLSQTEVAR